ncbi:tannase/feruloyl esterase family alpha/beta hydrolase [Solimonas terrae]|uniref:Tannase/feruloyl esterase family alpha/beta hydrolase n=1 Tax=Solimonas terrae TaxID=1396819 RepID=A0A6M2BTR3_9GAMM|nr:tannase/feruloyl esterase family alpha/beta hydrolase [Solimonas terrae]NGY05601.1 tannase/feruloyl esterase family alpha/beta hydrolase [Solimonas terrae]
MLLLPLLAALVGCVSKDVAERCERLAGLPLDHARVVAAEPHRGGREFSLAGAWFGRPFFHEPASCRVELELTPSADSKIRTAVWLPSEHWNGRLQGVGVGGFGGSIDTTSLRFSLENGSVGVGTDTGHEGNDRDGTWALGHPEKMKDFAWRAVHVSNVVARSLIQAYYGRPPEHAYFTGCSGGGREALVEAERFPQDYDGIMAGAPGLNILPAWAWIQLRIKRAGAFIPPQKIPTVAAATLAACDARDGVTDGIIDDPRRCHFDPAILQCKAGDRADCLTPGQVQSLRDIYSGPGAGFHGFEPGGELGDKGGWLTWITGKKPGDNFEYAYVQDFYRYTVYGDASWSLESFDFSRDSALMLNKGIEYGSDASDPDLSAFAARGGKLILYQGWSDPAVTPQTTVDFYESVRERMGAEQVADFARLYMVPGMQHCVGGPGPNFFGTMPPAAGADPHRDMAAALERWVENGSAPDAIIATKYDDDIQPFFAPQKAKRLRSRPLCPYPQVARWTGVGSTDLAENFRCTDVAQ